MGNKSGSVHLWGRRLAISAVLFVLAAGCLVVDVASDRLPYGSVLLQWSAPISFILATLSVLYLSATFWRSTMRGFKQKLFNIDSLISIGTLTAYIFSLISYIVYVAQHQTIFTNGEIQLYFTTVVFLYFFVVLGKWMEARATSRTAQSVRDLIKLRPRTAHLANGGSVIDIPTSELKVGDTLLVKPDETIPVDGHVVEGNSNVNESMITGESASVDKHVGSPVIGGTHNGHGKIKIVTERVGDDTLLSRIIKLITEAQNSRAPIESTADRLTNIFVPLVILAALATFLIWHFIIGEDILSAMMVFVTVIMIACPCSIGLAAPTAITVGINIGSRNGILVKNGTTLQQLSKVNTVVFDKTGTLTTGKPVVTDILTYEEIDSKEALTIASSLERHSEHSLAKAIIKKADAQNLETLPVKQFGTIANRGIVGVINGTKYYLGNEKFADEHIDEDLPDVSKLATASKTICYLFTNRKVLAVIAIADQLKTSSVETIRELNRMHIDTYLLSGDSEAAAMAIAKRLGIKNIIADVMPDAKAEEILRLRQSGKRVAMVGDGINDAPAIASANVGIAIGTGTDAAIETGDVVLVNGEPDAICAAIRLARSTMAKVRENLFFSLVYNVASIPVAAGALSFVGVTLRPELAGIIMAMSTAAVIVNSLTLKATNITKRHDPMRFIAPIVLFLLFTAIYIEVVLV